MKEVTTDEALSDLSKYLRDVYCWCDADGSYTSGIISVSRYTVRMIRRCVDAIREAASSNAMVKVPEGYDSVYERLSAGKWTKQ